MNRLVAALWCAGLAACAAGQDAKQPYAQPLGGGAVRFFESEEAFKAAPQSFVLESQKRPVLPTPEKFPLTPEFGSAGESRTITIKTPPDVSFYGLGMAAGPMLRNGFKSGDGAVECPWIMGMRPDGTAFGVLPDTSYACRVDLTQGVVITTDAPHPGVIVFDSADPHELLVTLNQATGRMEMPPQWALGMGLSLPRGLLEGIRRLRAAEVPLEWIALNDRYNEFRIGSKPNLDAVALLAELAKEHLRVALSLCPGDAMTYEDPLFASGQAANAWILGVDGSPIGSAEHPPWVMPDFTQSSVRGWWAQSVRTFSECGVSGLIVSDPATPVSEGSVLKADAALGGPGSRRQYDAWMPVLWARATQEGFAGEQQNQRPILWDDHYVPTIQRSAASLIRARSLGDHAAPRSRLDSALSLSLSGQPLASDSMVLINGEETERLEGLASLMPMVCPAGARFDTPRAITDGQLQTLKVAMSRRSRLIPYYYTLCFNAFRDCEPILRPLFFADPKDLTLRDRDDAFFVGPDLLVVPKLEKDKPKPPCPLKGGWRKIRLDDIENPDLPDLYLRPGAILPLGPVMQYTSEKPVDPLTLLVNLDEAGVAVGSLYEDDGDGYAFYRNECRRLGYRAERKDGAIFLRLSAQDGGMPLPRRKVEVRILTDAGELSATGSERGTIKIDLPKDSPKPP